MNWTRTDYIHGAIHLLGCYAATLTLLVLGLPFWLALALAFAVGVKWEMLDVANQVLHWDVWFLDNRGADVRDCLADLIGIILAGGVWWLG